LRELLFSFHLGIKVCQWGTVYELSLLPWEGKSHFHPVIARLTPSVEAISWWSMRLPRPDKPGLAMTPLQLNGDAERAQRTRTKEFYEVMHTSFEIAELNQALLEWERVYNTVRPHQAAGYLTPKEFLKIRRQKKKRKRCQ
jgi:transposase InsO family protein